jgi:mannose-6-phosphate isomerase-like protein (cupin superfamily)
VIDGVTTNGGTRHLGPSQVAAPASDHLALVTGRTHVRPEKALEELPAGQGSAPVILYGDLIVRAYRPRLDEFECRHDRDELYVIARGAGSMLNGSHSCGDDPIQHFAAGDVLFVPANVIHRFYDVSDDCLIWTIFCGPVGGQATADRELRDERDADPDNA